MTTNTTTNTKCVNCRNELDSPVFLPCCCSICRKHTVDVNGPIICCLCEIEHPIPQNGLNFPSNTALAQFIDARHRDIFSKQEHKEANEFCSRFDELLKQFEQILADPFNFTYETITFLKNTVQMRGEEMKIEIDEAMNHVMNKLEEYKEECKLSLKSREYLDKSEMIRIDKDKRRGELEEWLEKLGADDVELNEFNKVKIECEQAIKRLENDMDLFKSRDLLLQKYWIFQKKIKKGFGNFEIDPLLNLR
jgi:hypothetical protein